MTVAAAKKTYTTKILIESDGTGLQVPFDPVPVFGRVRAPVKVTLHGYTDRSTIFRMNGEDFLPLASSRPITKHASKAKPAKKARR